MTVQCITCTHIDTKTDTAMSKMGLPRCGVDHNKTWRMVSISYPRQCDKHKPVSKDEAAKRQAWWASNA